jgi:hypothetical protein
VFKTILADFNNEEHVKAMTEMRNTYRHYFFTSGILTEDQTREWLKSKANNPLDMIFLVSERDSQTNEFKISGMFSIHNFYESNPYIDGSKGAELGRVMYTGVRKEAFRFLIQNRLSLLASIYNLKYYYLSLKIWNKRALIFYGKIGFHIVDIEDDKIIMTMEV